MNWFLDNYQLLRKYEKKVKKAREKYLDSIKDQENEGYLYSYSNENKAEKRYIKAIQKYNNFLLYTLQ